MVHLEKRSLNRIALVVRRINLAKVSSHTECQALPLKQKILVCSTDYISQVRSGPTEVTLELEVPGQFGQNYVYHYNYYNC